MRKRWTDKELEILKKNYGKVSKEEIEEKLPERSIHAIRMKAINLDLTEERPEEWSSEEIKILKENYRYGDRQKIEGLLAKRTWSGIKSKAHEIGIQRTAKEMSIAEKNLRLTEKEKAYLAGVIDCDGSITIYRQKSSKARRDFILKPEIKISNNSRNLTERLHSQLETGQLTQDYRDGCYYLSIEGKACLPVAREVQPYLVVKTKQNAILISWCESRLEREERYGSYTDKELELQKKIQALNQR